MAERAARHLWNGCGEHVAAHHGSLSPLRIDAESNAQARRTGLRWWPPHRWNWHQTSATSTGLPARQPAASPLPCSGCLGHHGWVPKGRLTRPTRRHDLPECAMLDADRRGELDQAADAEAPLDAGAEPCRAEVANRDCDEDDCSRWCAGLILICCCRALRLRAMRCWACWPRATRAASGARRVGAPGRGQPPAARAQGRAPVVGPCAAPCPDVGTATVVLEPQAVSIGTVNEDCAIESPAGDIFQLGNASYRIRKIVSQRAAGSRMRRARRRRPGSSGWARRLRRVVACGLAPEDFSSGRRRRCRCVAA